MVARRLERMVRQVRRWRSSDGSTPIPVDPTLGEADRRRLCRLIDDCIDAKGGELAARRRASAIAATFLTLDDLGRRRFFLTLAHDYDHDDAAVDTAVDALVRSRDPEDRRDAERRLAHALTPSRERLLQRFIGLEDGLSFVVDLREELRSHREGDPALTALDQELRHLLTDWFHLGILQLESITWDSPAALLEKLIEYEAVHEITSWADMKGRLGRGRRCYGFFHPLMPGEPLIFVEVAMTTDIAADLGPLLDHDADRIASQDAETANFYSISNCQRGLAGVPLGDMLIKQVAERLQADLPNLRRFATLSPIPGFRDWLIDALDDGAPAVLTEAEAELLATEYRLVQTDEAMDQIRDLRERCAGLEVGPTFATRLREVEARILGQSDDPDEVRQAEALLRQVASEWETQQEPLRAARAIRWLASAPLVPFGHYREGLQALERAVPLSRSQSFDYGLTMASKAAFDGFVGDADALALSSTQARAALEGGGAACMLGYCEYGAAAIARLEGSVEGVMRHGRRAVDLIGSIYGYTFASVYGPIALMLAELDEPVMARALLDRLHRDLRVGSGEWVERSIAEIAVTAAEGDLDDAKARWRELSKHPLCPVDRHWRIDLFLAKLDPGGGFDRDRILSDAYRLGLGEVALRLWPEIVQADPAPQAPVRIHVLGDLRVTVNGDPVRIPEGHVRDVVSLLMVSNRSANLETVLDRLWPDAGLDDAKRRFKNVMRRMRDLLGDAAVARESNKVFFTDQVSSDLEDFEAAWASALGTQRSDPAAAARAAVTALELYSGPLLSDDPFDERVGRLRVALSDQAEDLLSIVRSSPDSQQRSPAWIAAAEQRVYREV